LRYAAAARVRHDVVEQRAAQKSAERRHDYGENERGVTSSVESAVDHVSFDEPDAQVKRDRRETAYDAERHGERKQPLRFGRRKLELCADPIQSPQPKQRAELARRLAKGPTRASLGR
jgi:hypothetical protein